MADFLRNSSSGSKSTPPWANKSDPAVRCESNWKWGSCVDAMSLTDTLVLCAGEKKWVEGIVGDASFRQTRGKRKQSVNGCGRRPSEQDIHK
jgi:hypothetical protein